MFRIGCLVEAELNRYRALSDRINIYIDILKHDIKSARVLAVKHGFQDNLIGWEALSVAVMHHQPRVRSNLFGEEGEMVGCGCGSIKYHCLEFIDIEKKVMRL